MLPALAEIRPWWLVVHEHRRTLAVVAILALAVPLVGVLVVASFGGNYQPAELAVAVPGSVASTEQAAEELEALSPRGLYVLVDTYGNRLRVYKDGELLREAICSTGSGVVLRDPRNGREWVFDTPVGERKVIRKVRQPIWYKPDWAFIEQGMMPPKNSNARADDFSLGDYGLYLGDGYIIHGTLFQTLLGSRLTHGCIRLGDADLEYVYQHVPVGTPVYLY